MSIKPYQLWAAPASGELSTDLVGVCDSIEAAAGDSAASPKISMTVYTGGLIKPRVNPPLDYPLVVDLAGLEMPTDQRPILKDHNPSQHVGHTTRFVNDGRTLMAEGLASGTGATAREVIGSAKNGFKWQVSFGLLFAQPELIGPGQTIKVNGQLVAGPVYVVRQSRVREVSLLTLGADDNTSARIAAQAANGVPMTFEQWLKAKGFTLDALNDQQKLTLEAAFTAETATATKATKTIEATGADDVDPLKASRDALLTERRRQSGVVAVLDKYKARVPADKFATIEASAIGDNWDTDKLELNLLREARPQATGAAHAGTGNESRLDAGVVEAAMSLSAGIPEETVAKSLPSDKRERVMNSALGRDMRGYGLHSLMDGVIHAAGDHYAGSRKANGYIQATLAAERTLQAAGFSTLSLSGILANVANKGLLASYTAVETVWSRFCAVRNHSDFKVHTRYRLDSTGAFKKVGADGELKNISLTDASYTNQLATYGAIINLTRQMMINDDLGAFMEIPNLLGRMAALRVEEAAFVLLLSNPSSFFATGNTNYATGAGSALSLTSLTTAEQKFRDMVDSNGKPILVSPKTILVGTPLATTAENIFAQQLLIADGVGSSASLKPNRNPFTGKYPPIVSPYLSNTAIKDQDGAAITGQSSTRWYMFADPAVRAAIAVAFLNGQQTPTIESSQAEFETLGMKWRAFHDFGVGMEETSAAVMNDGA